MKINRLFGPLAVFFACMLFAGTAWAVPITMNEVFLGGKNDAQSFSLVEKNNPFNAPGTGNKARFSFDLTGSGGTGQLLSGNQTVGSPVDPTRDETLYDPLIYDTPYLAYVDFFISDWYLEAEPDSPEKVRINIESGTVVKNRSFTLENDADGSKRVRVNLADEGMLDLLSDGELLAMAIAPAFGDVVNSFTLDRVVLYAEANPTPVPEPASMLLMGSGLLGMALAGRRQALKS